MAIDLKFDLVGNPEVPTLILANRNGNMLGQLKVNENSVDLSDKLNDASELSFTVNKYVDGKVTPLWNKLVDFKLIYCKELECWFEASVELDEATETVKTVMCTQLEPAELSQLMLYNIEINTEDDIARDDYKITILYDRYDSGSSMLHRLLNDKAPHYSISYVSPTIASIQRSFSFDDISIYDAFQEISEEIGCLFQFSSKLDGDGTLKRSISVYDLQQNCKSCGHRGEFTDKCPKCNSTNIENGYGEDTLIFVTSDELASDGIQLVTDVDSVKNCFKLEAGDDLMTATVRNCNPNGSDYIWYFSDSLKEDMSKELVERLESYNEVYREYYNEHTSELDSSLLDGYNLLIDKYKKYNEGLHELNMPIVGYSSLMNAYYDIVDLELYLSSGLMPSIKMEGTDASKQAEMLKDMAIYPVSVTDTNIVSLPTANSAVLSMAKTIIRPTYRIQVDSSELVSEGISKYWKGKFVVTNYSDDEDSAVSELISILINDDIESFVKQKIEKALNNENTDDLSISELFKKEHESFCEELKKYAMNPLISFRDACQSCIDILIDQGIGNKDSCSSTEEGSDSNLYEKLYVPYYNKLKAIESEIKIREGEINIIAGIYDADGNLTQAGLRANIEGIKCEIQKSLDFEKHLGKELWIEFCAYRREDKYSNENYISDGLNNAELFKRAMEFYEVAENEIFKSSELQHSISTTLNNLLAIPKFKKLVNSFKLGNWIRVRVNDGIYKLRLIQYDIGFDGFGKIPVEFSDVMKIKNGITDVQDVLAQASSMATSYNSVQKQANQGDKANNMIEQWLYDGLNSAFVQIQNNNNEEITLTKNGLLCRTYDDISGEYSPEQLKITHNVMAYTDDDWASVKQAIGKHEYVLYDNGAKGFVGKVGYGMSADFVVAGIVSGSQIIGGDIYSDNYSETTGSYLNLRDGTFSFGGGSLRYNGEKLIISSNSADSNITEINEGWLKTTDVYAENLKVSSAQIQGQLTASQINTIGLVAENISGTTITGKIIEGSTINGGSINIGDYFSVDTYGNMTSTSGSIGGWNVDSNGIYYGGENSGVATVGMGVNNPDWAFWAGFGDGKANFRVTRGGILYATGAQISGHIESASGNIGGWNVDNNGIYYGGENSGVALMGMGINNTDWAFWAGYYGGADANFRVTQNGILHATGAVISGTIYASDGEFTGKITSTSGSIGNWTINGQALQGSSHAGTVTLSPLGITAPYTDVNGNIGSTTITWLRLMDAILQ